MSSWSMNDGSALTGTYTFTNGSAVVQGNSSADTSEIKVGDIVIDDNGDKVRVANLEPTRTVATSAVNASNEQITITDHGFVANTPLTYRAGGGTAITELTDGAVVFVKTVSSADAFTISATAGGTEIDITGTGNNAQSFQGTSTKAFTITEAFSPSTNSGSSCTVTRPPLNFASAAPHIDGNILGVNIAEMTGGSDNIVNLTIENAGSGYAASPAPSVTVSGGGGSSGAATVTITANKVSAITLTNAGTGYTSEPSVTTTAPAEVTFNAASAVDGTDITLTSHPFATGDTVTYSDKGGTAIAELTDGGTFKVIKVDANTIRLHNGSGDAITLTDGPSENHGLTGETATFGVSLGSTGIPHAGWVKKTVGTGGRAGRVSYEVLVASSTISGDASDDAALPDS